MLNILTGLIEIYWFQSSFSVSDHHLYKLYLCLSDTGKESEYEEDGGGDEEDAAHHDKHSKEEEEVKKFSHNSPFMYNIK